MSPQAHHGLCRGVRREPAHPVGPGCVGPGAGAAAARSWSPTRPHSCEVLRANDELPATMPMSVVEDIVQVFRALLTVPVFIGDRPTATLSLYYHDSRPFSQEEIELVQTMADQAALAIEAARLREQAKTSAAAEERNRLARELHDSVTQNLYSVTLYAEAAARLLAVGPDGAGGRAPARSARYLAGGAAGDAAADLRAAADGPAEDGAWRAQSRHVCRPWRRVAACRPSWCRTASSSRRC